MNGKEEMWKVNDDFKFWIWMMAGGEKKRYVNERLETVKVKVKQWWSIWIRAR